jgi:hypothetical protein
MLLSSRVLAPEYGTMISGSGTAGSFNRDTSGSSYVLTSSVDQDENALESKGFTTVYSSRASVDVFAGMSDGSINGGGYLIKLVQYLQ